MKKLHYVHYNTSQSPDAQSCLPCDRRREPLLRMINCSWSVLQQLFFSVQMAVDKVLTFHLHTHLSIRLEDPISLASITQASHWLSILCRSKNQTQLLLSNDLN